MSHVWMSHVWHIMSHVHVTMSAMEAVGELERDTPSSTNCVNMSHEVCRWVTNSLNMSHSPSLTSNLAVGGSERDTPSATNCSSWLIYILRMHNDIAIWFIDSSTSSMTHYRLVVHECVSLFIIRVCAVRVTYTRMHLCATQIFFWLASEHFFSHPKPSFFLTCESVWGGYGQ